MNPIPIIFNIILQIITAVFAGPSLLLVQLALEPIIPFLFQTRLDLTVQHPVVMTGWRSLVGVADGLLVIFVLVGLIQTMYGDAVGALRMPPGKLVAKALLTVFLIHLSAFFGEILVKLNNGLCSLLVANIGNFIRQVNGGQNFNNIQLAIVSAVFASIFIFSFFRVLFQVFQRLIRFNVLFVLSGLAILCSFQPLTTPIFSVWGRMYVSTIFEQFFQVLALSLGIQFVIAVKLTGFPGFLVAIAMLNFVAAIPKLLERFGGAAVGGGSAGNLIGTVVKVAALLA